MIKGMNIYLTMAVYSVRIADIFPTEATYVPLVFIFLLMASIYTFLILCWFVYKNYLEERDQLPGFWMSMVDLVKRLKPRTKESPRSSQEIEIEYIDSNKELELIVTEKCNNCLLCVECSAKKDKEKNSKADAEEKKRIICVLNRIVFFIFVVIYILTYAAIWINITN
jgi:hypothetical protein